jgi:hypothetical protein
MLITLALMRDTPDITPNTTPNIAPDVAPTVVRVWDVVKGIVNRIVEVARVVAVESWYTPLLSVSSFFCPVGRGA